MRFLAIFLILLFLFSCSKGTEVTTKQRTGEEPGNEAPYKKDMDELKKNLKSEVRIKLKKDGKGSYSWEIIGKDAEGVLKANDTLRKKLNE